MVLLEFVQGETMLDITDRATQDEELQYHLLPSEEDRLQVIKNLIEAEEAIEWWGMLESADHHPRNVIVGSDCSVTLIDFGLVYFRSRWPEVRERMREERRGLHPPSPIERLWGDYAYTEVRGEWSGYVPESWIGNDENFHEWLLDTFGNSDKYQPLSESWLNEERHAKLSPRLLARLEAFGRKKKD
ncbi:hypothetical protein B0T24DRAFT_642915 [Lasiosphaeria ovina]|uniref:Protein kinase domain-containing protein n=1 Tax=Lasiosphaeria ovina TaxID=92902 RepID=A0AAE0JT29_9PEZI|nr:hypothetical protein B0T24DRAFT_642915 [Lasiosphaeria ovina]